MNVVFNLWKEIGSHLEFESMLPNLAAILTSELPVSSVLIRRLLMKEQRLETLAAFSFPPDHVPDEARTDLTLEQVNRLVSWCGLSRITAIRPGSETPLPSTILVPGLSSEALVGPLAGAEGQIGLLILVCRDHDIFQKPPDTMQEILVPFSAAFANHLRIHTLERQRQAIEADKDALLSRLQRQDISESIVGAETGLRTVMEEVEQVARTDAPVLIFGETGTGKEVIARTIHKLSRRASGPMFRVNCGAIPPELVDSELFGHERGSFTGAHTERKGWFERADGGTLFLDEMAELPLAAQVRLLRVLQDGSLERVGGQRSLSVDVRVVAATNADLADMVTTGRFRQDLWYRVSVFPIHLPPLRERINDIPALAAHFAWRAGKRLGGGPLAPCASDIHLLVSYPWPGNVRELAAVIERAVILGNGKTLEIAAALGGSAPRGRPSTTRAPAFVALPNEPLTTLDQAMSDHIEKALAATGGRIEGERGAARLLGINPHTLRARMRRLGVDWKRFKR